MMEKTFEEDLRGLLNTHSAENRSNTPDYILANYILTCLNAFDDAVNERAKWYKHDEDREQ